VAWTQGGHDYTVTSGRTARGRLTWTDTNAVATADAVERAPLDAPAFSGFGVDRAHIRRAMVAWLRTLVPAADQGRTTLSPELVKDLRAHGYFGAGQ
jgi:hypothetical protein